MSDANVSCGHNDQYSTVRFASIIISSAFATLGVIFNSTLVAIFVLLSWRDTSQRTSRLYLTVLALMDACLCLSFVLVFGVDAVALRFRVPFLFHFYYDTIQYSFALSRSVQLCIPYIIIVTTFERWLGGTGYQFSPWFNNLTSDTARVVICSSVVLVCVALKMPCHLIYRVEQFKDCDRLFDSIQMVPTEFSANPTFQFYNFYILSVLQVFVPFALLIPLNLAIVRNVRSGRDSLYQNLKANISRKIPRVSSLLIANDSDAQSRSSSLSRIPFTKRKLAMPAAAMAVAGDPSQHEKVLRQAVYTVIVIVSSYIICNVPNFLLTIMEKLKLSILEDQTGNASDFYLVCSDVISIFFMVNSFVRVLIHYFCNGQVRQQLAHMVCLNRLAKSPVQSNKNTICADAVDGNDLHDYYLMQRSRQNTDPWRTRRKSANAMLLNDCVNNANSIMVVTSTI